MKALSPTPNQNIISRATAAGEKRRAQLLLASLMTEASILCYEVDSRQHRGRLRAAVPPSHVDAIAHS